MAGTRLAIQSIFVGEFFLLALAALYFGLYKTKDPISFHLPIYQKGRAIIVQALQDLERDQTPLRVPLLRIAASTQEDADRLEKLLVGQGLSFQVLVENDTNILCQSIRTGGVATSGNDPNYSILVCPTDLNETPSVLVRNGLTFLFSDKPETMDSLFQDLIASSTIRSYQRKPLKFLLMMEHRNDWNEFAKSFSQWLENEEESLNSWQPCIRGEIQAQVVLSTLVAAPATKEVPRIIPTIHMKKSVIDRQADPNAWNVILYVPRMAPAQFADDNGNLSRAMYVDNTLVSTIHQPELETRQDTITSTDEHGNETTTVQVTEIPVPVNDLVNQAMVPLEEFLLRQCMGVMPLANQEDSDESLALWRLEAWFQRALAEKYQQARSEIRLEGEWLLQSSTWVVIDEGVAAHWQTLIRWMQEVKETTFQTDSEGYDHYLEATELLEQILEYLQALRTDPTLMEPLRFSLPQFMAIFAPFCLPLFLPHVIGLFREYKRYKKLKEARVSTS